MYVTSIFLSTTADSNNVEMEKTATDDMDVKLSNWSLIVNLFEAVDTGELYPDWRTVDLGANDTIRNTTEQASHDTKITNARRLVMSVSCVSVLVPSGIGESKTFMI